ncbi:MAG: aminotransferase class V-fold PLP-dependent enzyme [Clostridia bacterium]|nr:aminotransferase class V-fold PLP-dependent enzyme [Clostridia bacterium]
MIYLDNAATTKVNIDAVKKAEYLLFDEFYNPSAKYHGGITAQNVIKQAKNTFSKVFGANFEAIFTSCGTESDNTAIYSYTKRGNAVTTLGEHSAVFAPLDSIMKSGGDVRFAKINSDGSVNVENLLSLIDNNTTFVSVVHVNNETGAINDINSIAKRCKEKNPRLVFHSDGVQAFGKISVKLSNYIDLYSLSAHKIGGLKGVGALIKNKSLKSLKPYIIGGGQENGLRSGTENVFGINVFETVLLDKIVNFDKNFKHVTALKEEFLSKIDKTLFKVISSDNSSPYVISLSAVGLKGEVLQHMLEKDGIFVGTGSACSAKNPFSRVLKEAGYDEKVLNGIIRISFNSDTQLSDVAFTSQKLNENAMNLKRAMYNL